MDSKEIKALISLLDDPDESVYQQVTEKLLSLGQDVIPELESAWETSFDNLLQNRIEGIIHRIQFRKTEDALKSWFASEKKELLEGALVITRYQYPDLDEKKIRKFIEQLKQDVWIELNNNLTALEKVRVVNHILFDVHNFSGNTTNYHAPQNSYLNNVLETKKGNPLSLGILYCLISQDLGLPIYGVNLPGHFILAFLDTTGIVPIVSNDESDKVLFYINAFSRGTILGRKEIDNFLKQLNRAPEKQYYEPCSNPDMIKRLIRNLIESYEKSGYAVKVEELTSLLKIFS